MIYLLLGIASIFLIAYDTFSNSFDFEMSGGWKIIYFQKYLMWAIIIVLAPISFVVGVYKLFSDLSYAQKWKRDGSFTRRIK
jgi:hypothetical protein